MSKLWPLFMALILHYSLSAQAQAPRTQPATADTESEIVDTAEEAPPIPTPDRVFPLSANFYSEFTNWGLNTSERPTRENTYLWNALTVGTTLSERFTLSGSWAFLLSNHSSEREKTNFYEWDWPYLTLAGRDLIPNNHGITFSGYARHYFWGPGLADGAGNFSRFSFSGRGNIGRDLSLQLATQPYYYWDGHDKNRSRKRVRNFITLDYAASNRSTVTLESELAYNRVEGSDDKWRYYLWPKFDYALTDTVSITPFVRINLEEINMRHTVAFVGFTFLLL